MKLNHTLHFLLHITYNNFFITILLIITDHSNLPNSQMNIAGSTQTRTRWTSCPPSPKRSHIYSVSLLTKNKNKKYSQPSPWLATYRAEKANTVSTYAAALSSSRLPNVSTRSLRPPPVSARPSSSANSQLVLVLVLLTPDPHVGGIVVT
jgi:hypothetical protein